TSGIGKALAIELAGLHHNLILAGRNLAELDAQGRDLSIRYGVQTEIFEFDVLSPLSLGQPLNAMLEKHGDALETAILCVGYLGTPERAEDDPVEAKRVLDSNFTGCVLVLQAVARHFAARRHGVICAVSSVAGDRGRQSNYLYCAAKGGLSVYLQGLRNRLHRYGVHVITVKPGFVDTAMTYGKPGLFLLASPQSAARGILKAIRKKKDVAYVPGFWRGIMLAIRLIPEPAFKRMRL
ncbi:MAG: SDR family NAD(P)-dependent oxidoreductase, partial [Terriglobia bacterium]